MIGPDLTKVTNVLPHEGGYNVGTATDSHVTKVVMQSDPAGSGFSSKLYPAGRKPSYFSCI